MNVQQTQRLIDNVYETPDYFISVLFKWDKELQKIKKEEEKQIKRLKKEAEKETKRLKKSLKSILI
jgi:predicted PurR-regulated permease PerM